MRYTKADVKREIKNLERRLKTITEHTGFTFEIDKDYYLNSKNRKKAVEQLKKGSWRDFDNGIKLPSHVKAIAHGTLNYKYKKGDVNVELSSKDMLELSRLIGRREKAEGRKINVNIQSQKAIKSVKQYLSKIQTKQQALEEKNKRNLNAIQNFQNNVREAANASGSPGIQMIAKVLEDQNFLLGKYDPVKFKKMYDALGYNIYDSKDLAKIIGNPELLAKELKEYLGITDEDLIIEAAMANKPLEYALQVKDDLLLNISDREIEQIYINWGIIGKRGK